MSPPPPRSARQAQPLDVEPRFLNSLVAKKQMDALCGQMFLYP